VIRAVIDTSVMVSGLLTASGNEALILLAIHQGLVRPCLSTDILQEYTVVLARPKFTFAPGDVAALLAMLHSKGELFRPTESTAISPDAADTKFLHCAAAAQADFLVTDNKRDFPNECYGATRIVSAGQLLDRITLAI
jgi:putative PIN family toxin of toxin-antitoxin system